MAVTHASDYLDEQVSGNILFELPPSPNIRKQVTTSTNLHYENDMLLCLEGFVEPDDVAVTGAPQDIEFLHNFAL